MSAPQGKKSSKGSKGSSSQQTAAGEVTAALRCSSSGAESQLLCSLS